MAGLYQFTHNPPVVIMSNIFILKSFVLGDKLQDHPITNRAKEFGFYAKTYGEMLTEKNRPQGSNGF